MSGSSRPTARRLAYTSANRMNSSGERTRRATNSGWRCTRSNRSAMRSALRSLSRRVSRRYACSRIASSPTRWPSRISNGRPAANGSNSSRWASIQSMPFSMKAFSASAALPLGGYRTLSTGVAVGGRAARSSTTEEPLLNDLRDRVDVRCRGAMRLDRELVTDPEDLRVHLGKAAVQRTFRSLDGVLREVVERRDAARLELRDERLRLHLREGLERSVADRLVDGALGSHGRNPLSIVNWALRLSTFGSG